MNLSIYKKAGLFYVNGVIVPENTYRCAIESIKGIDCITIEDVGQNINLFSRIPVTSINKEVGQYANLAGFITDCGELFTTTLKIIKNGIPTAVNDNDPIPVKLIGNISDATNIRFVKNSANVLVNEDTVTPANNTPLPVKLTGVTGDVIINAGDLQVNLSDKGANYDITRLGDGINELGFTVDKEAKVNSRIASIFDVITGAYKQLAFAGKGLRVNAQSYLQALSEGDISNHAPFTKIGYSPSQTANQNTDIWSYSATQPVYLFPTVAMQMEVLSTNNADDIGTVIHSGTSTGGTTTSLISAGENFLTTTAVGDTVILDKSGSIPEFGYITAIVSNTELTIGNGFSYGGSGSGRTYSIIDESATAGAHAVEVQYLDGNYIEKREIIILNGTTVLPTVNVDLFRVNAFRVVAAGANKVPTGNLSIRHLANTPVYSYISAGFNRARNIMFTVPAGKSVYITDISGGYATAGNANKEYGRITTRANIDPSTKFRTDNVFYPFTDSVSQNTTINSVLQCPTKLPSKTDVKCSVISSATGVVMITLRGWVEID